MARPPRGALSELETYLFAKYKYETAVATTARDLRETAAADAAVAADAAGPLSAWEPRGRRPEPCAGEPPPARRPRRTGPE